jgi:hypothetical protein
MAALDPQTVGYRLESILTLVQSNDDYRALLRIADLVLDLRSLAEAPIQAGSNPRDNGGPGPEPEPWRVIAAHLKAAEIQLQETHRSPAEESIAKAIYVAVRGTQQAADAQLNV